MEEDWDSDETVIEGSVISDLEEDELPGRRLLFDQDASLRSLYSLHPDINATGKGVLSPEIQLGFKLREDPQKQLSTNKITLLSEDDILQKPQDEVEQSQFLLQTTQNCPMFTESLPQAELLLNQQSIQVPESDDKSEVFPHPGKELSEDSDSAEFSLLSGTRITVSENNALVKDKLLIEPQKMLSGSHVYSEPRMELPLDMTSEKAKNEEDSLETFVSAQEIIEEDRLLEIISDFEPTELKTPLSHSSFSMPMLLTCHRDLLKNTNDNAMPPELLSAINTMSEAQVDPIYCREEEEGSNVGAGSKHLEGEPILSQTQEDCTQIAEASFDAHGLISRCEQDSKLAELQDEHLPVQPVEDQIPFGSQALVHQNVTFCDPLNNEGNSKPLENNSDKDTPGVLRRSSRLKITTCEKYSDDLYTVPKKILQKILACEVQTNRNSSNKNLRLRSREQIRKSKKNAEKYDKKKFNNILLATINRKNKFGENLLYRAALRDDTDLVIHCLKKGGNVNQQCYAGWTALHEACVGGFYQTASELIKGGADVNIKGKYQITPLHDAVMNGHYKVAELLLSNGADPFLRSDNGKCALDEAKNSQMKHLFERYVSKQQKPLESAQNRIMPVNVEDMQHDKKTKFHSRKCTGFTSDGNSKRENPEHVNIDRESKEYLLINEDDVYEDCQKGSKNRRHGKSKHKHLILSQTNSTGLRKESLHYVKEHSSNKDKGIRKIQHNQTQLDDMIQEDLPRKTVAVSSHGKIRRLVIAQQQSPQNLENFPEESCIPTSPALSRPKSDFGNTIEAYSITQETYNKDLSSSNSQEIKMLELLSTNQTEAISFSGLSLHKEVELPFVTTEQPSHSHKEQEQNSSSKSCEGTILKQKGVSINKWENSFRVFIEKKLNDEFDHCTSQKIVVSKTVMSSVDGKTHCDYEENMTYRGEMDFQSRLLSEDHFSQGNEFKEDTLTILSQQEAVHFSDSDNTIVSGQHVTSYDQCMYETSFHHSHSNLEHTSFDHTRTLSTQEISELPSQVELLEKSQDSPTWPAPLMNQIDARVTERLDQYRETERSISDKSQNPDSSNTPLHTVQEKATMTGEQRKQDLPESAVMHNIKFHSTDYTNKDSANISQFSQREERKASHKTDKESTNNIIENKITVRNCEVEEVRTGLEIHMPTCYVQEHKNGQNFSPNQNHFKDICSQEMKTAGVNKQNATGESQLHSVARRGNLSLVKALIESGAAVNLKDNAGSTPLHEAVNEGIKDGTEELLKAGANVNCENVDRILPLPGAVANNHLKAADILLKHRTNNKKRKAALDETGDKTMKEPRKSYGAIETDDRDESNSVDTVRTKRHKQYFCDDHKTIDPPFLTHQGQTEEIHPVHHTISAVLQDIEEKQENLLKFEIKTPEDAVDYIEKMSAIKEVMDSVDAKQKAERDDIAKKYRVSIESFKHGVLREQLANLATRQKKLLIVVKNQEEISLKIQNYKNVGLNLKKQPPTSKISRCKSSQECTSLGNAVPSQSRVLFPVSPICGTSQGTRLSLDIWNNSQDTNTYSVAETRREDISVNEMNAKPNVNTYSLAGSSECGQSDGTKLFSKPCTSITLEEYSQDNYNNETIAKGPDSFSPSTENGTLNISQTTNKPFPSTTFSDQTLCNRDPKNGSRKIVSQQPCQGSSESQAQTFALFGSKARHQIMKPHQKLAFAAPHANDNQDCCLSVSDTLHTSRKSSKYSTVPKKKCMQIKDLILLGKINPGKNILEFKTQESIHKASILMSGKIKVESGQIYQNPVTWLKDLLGSNSYVTWNYAWSKVTYLGKELIKYISDEVPTLPDADSEAQQHQLCLPGVSRESMQSIPHYLQFNEILLNSDQEFLPHHIMDKYWKSYVECDELPF